MTCTVVLAIVLYAVVILKAREDSSMFTSSLVVTYCLYLQWSALSSDMDPTCNPFSFAIINNPHNAKANTITMMVMGLIFTFVSLLTISGKTRKVDESGLATTLNSQMIEDEGDSGERCSDYVDEGGKTKSAQEMHVFPITTATICFQALLTCAAIYYAMLLTNWGMPVYLNSNSASFFSDSNSTSYWCQLSAMWISMAIYLFSCLAPLLFPDR